MDRKLRKILTECIRDIETGARDVEGCLQQHPDRAAELRPHLELWSGLDAAPKAQPNFGSQQRGQHQMLGALADMEKRGERRMVPFLTPALAKVAAVMAGVALLAAGTAGASAALGGPNVASPVLSGIGVSSASDTGLEHVNDNAFDGSDNADQGIDNADEHAQTGKDCASENAFEGSGNSEDRASNADAEHGSSDCPNSDDGNDADEEIQDASEAPEAAEDGHDTADEHGHDGAVEPSDGAGDASGDIVPDDAPPHDVPPDSVPDDAPAPDSVPVQPNQ